jgi:hypothetical protein
LIKLVNGLLTEGLQARRLRENPDRMLEKLVNR